MRDCRGSLITPDGAVQCARLVAHDGTPAAPHAGLDGDGNYREWTDRS